MAVPRMADNCKLPMNSGTPRYYCDYRHDGRHFLSFVMYISGAKFEKRCFNISIDIPDLMLYCFSGIMNDLRRD